MRKLLVLVFLIHSVVCFSQIFNPVSWEFKTNILDDKSAELIFKANIDEGWKLYSQYNSEDPVTVFSFDDNDYYKLNDNVIENGSIIEKYEPLFGYILKYYKSNVSFNQVISINSNQGFNLNGYLEFMACDEEMCLPPEIQDSNVFFSKMQKLNDSIKLNELSMGMSGDYLTAIKYSSSYVRIGSKIFGERS